MKYVMPLLLSFVVYLVRSTFTCVGIEGIVPLDALDHWFRFRVIIEKNNTSTVLIMV